MPRQRLVPESDELQRMIGKGMTQQDIADEVFRRTGVKVTREAISAAMSRAKMPALRPRYADLLPWKINAAHDAHYAARMLRLEGRRRNGLDLGPEDERKLDSWKHHLRLNSLVVHYDEWSDDGFNYVKARPGIDTDLIRVSSN